jgi:hypothetical protein
MYPMEFLQEG